MLTIWRRFVVFIDWLSSHSGYLDIRSLMSGYSMSSSPCQCYLQSQCSAFGIQQSILVVSVVGMEVERAVTSPWTLVIECKFDQVPWKSFFLLLFWDFVVKDGVLLGGIV